MYHLRMQESDDAISAVEVILLQSLPCFWKRCICSSLSPDEGVVAISEDVVVALVSTASERALACGCAALHLNTGRPGKASKAGAEELTRRP